MAKVEFPVFVSPDNVLLATINPIPNKLNDHSEAAFSITLSNAISRTVIIDKMDFRPAPFKGPVPVKTDLSRSSVVIARTSVSSQGPSKIALKSLFPVVSHLEMLKNESLCVLLSLTKDMNFLVM
jgi:hypothetical protein